MLAASSAGANVPAPPAPGALEAYKRIATPPSPADVEQYVLLFSPSVKIIVNGKPVAVGRVEWKEYLVADAVWITKRRLTSYGNPVLVADSVYLPYDGCCLHTRFGVYHLDDQGLVDEVRFTDGGTFWDGFLQP